MVIIPPANHVKSLQTSPVLDEADGAFARKAPGRRIRTILDLRMD